MLRVSCSPDCAYSQAGLLATWSCSLLPPHHACAHSKHHGAILVEAAFKEMRETAQQNQGPCYRSHIWVNQKVLALQARRPELGVRIRKSSSVGWYTLTLSALGSVGRNTQIFGAQTASLTYLVSSRLLRLHKDVLWHPCVHAHTHTYVHKRRGL